MSSVLPEMSLSTPPLPGCTESVRRCPTGSSWDRRRRPAGPVQPTHAEGSLLRIGIFGPANQAGHGWNGVISARIDIGVVQTGRGQIRFFDAFHSLRNPDLFQFTQSIQVPASASQFSVNGLLESGHIDHAQNGVSVAQQGDESTKCGKSQGKDDVPSMGSRTQHNSASGLMSSCSSPMIPWSG